MPLFLSTWKRLFAASFLAILPVSVAAQSAFASRGGEYNIAGSIPGDQSFARLALGANGGYVVWQDNFSDGDGLGIGARRLDQNYSGNYSMLRVNKMGLGDQENARVAMLKDGGAVFVWQGGKQGFQRIYARFLSPAGTFTTQDILVNTHPGGHQVDPAIAVLADGSAVVTWSSFGQDGSQYGVYGQRLSASGAKLGGEFVVNQYTLNNQRNSVLATLTGGRFLVAWVGERTSGYANNPTVAGVYEGQSAVLPLYKVQIYARIFSGDGTPMGDEFVVDGGRYLAANPDAAGTEDGGFILVWSARVGTATIDQETRTHGWDVFVRSFNQVGAARGTETRVNGETHGDQYTPHVAAVGNDQLVVWTSVGQDGSREGVYGRFIDGSGALAPQEVRVNSTTASQQVFPVVSSDGKGTFLVVWSSFVGGLDSFDLFAQRFTTGQDRPAPGIPFVSALSQSKLSVTWPSLAGYDVAAYLLFVDGAINAVEVTGNAHTVSQLTAGSEHSFKLAYKFADGQISVQSATATAKTWGDDGNFDGLPDDWQIQHFGSDPNAWPAGSADSDGDRASNVQEFMAGTNPKSQASVLRTVITTDGLGPRLTWNSVPGAVYQVQSSSDFATWGNVGGARFAPGLTDSIPVQGSGSLSIYRVIRIR